MSSVIICWGEYNCNLFCYGIILHYRILLKRKGFRTMTASDGRFVVDSLAVMVCLGGNGTAPSVNIKVNNERVAIQPPGCYEFSFRKPTTVFVECFSSGGESQDRKGYTSKVVTVILAWDRSACIFTDKGEITICSGMPGVLVESEEPEPEAEVVEA